MSILLRARRRFGARLSLTAAELATERFASWVNKGDKELGSGHFNAFFTNVDYRGHVYRPVSILNPSSMSEEAPSVVTFGDNDEFSIVSAYGVAPSSEDLTLWLNTGFLHVGAGHSAPHVKVFLEEELNCSESVSLYARSVLSRLGL